MPVIGSKKYPFDEKTGKVLAEDRGPKGDSILKDEAGLSISNQEISYSLQEEKIFYC